MSVNPYAAGSVEYYQYQAQQSKRTQEQQAQRQVEQQLAYEAYQKANLEAQKSPTPQTITKQDIQTQRQQILDTRYVDPVNSTPNQTVYSVPVVTQQARDNATRANYENFQKANIDAQNRALQAERYDLFRQNQQSQALGQYTAYGRTPVHYSVELEDSLSGPNKQYFVNLYEGARPEQYGPANPFARESPRTQEARLATSATNPNFGESLIAGYSNYFSNIQETGSSVFGQLRPGKYAPEVEASVLKAVYEGTKDQPTGVRLLGQIAQESAENPGYAIGSIAASIGFTFGTIGAGKLVNLGREGIGALRVLRGASEVPEIAEVAARQAGFKDVSTQAFKVSAKTGEEIPLKQGQFGIYTQPVSKAGIKVSKPAIPDYFRIESKSIDKESGIITSLEDVGYTSPKTKQTEIITSVLDEKQANKFLQPNEGKPQASFYTEVAQKESSVFPKAEAGIFTGEGDQTAYTPIVKVTGGSKVGESIPIGGLVNYQNSELAKFIPEVSNTRGAAASKALGKVQSPFSGGSGGFSTGRSGATSVLENLSKQDKALIKNAALKDIGVFSEQGAKSGSSGLPAAIGNITKSIGGFSGYAGREKGSSSSGFSLGFGGATGAERKAKSKPLDELTQSFIPTPDISTKSTSDLLSKSIGDLSSVTGSRTKNQSIVGELTKSLEDITPKRGSSLNSLFSRESGARSSVKTDLAGVAGLSASSLFSGSSVTQKSLFRINIPTRTPPPSKNLNFVDFSLPGFGGEKKSKKRKKKGLGYGEGAFTRTDIVKNSVSSQIASIIDNAIGKVE